MSEVPRKTKLLAPIYATPQEIHSWLVDKYSQIRHVFSDDAGLRLLLTGVSDLKMNDLPYRVDIMGKSMQYDDEKGEINSFPVYSFEIRTARREHIEITAKNFIYDPEADETFEILIYLLRITFLDTEAIVPPPKGSAPTTTKFSRPGRPRKPGYSAAASQIKNNGLTVDQAFAWWKDNFPAEYNKFADYAAAKKAFSKAMNMYRSKKVQNP